MNPETLPLALEYFRAGDFARAEQVCRQIVEADPGQIDAWYYLAEIYLAYRRFSEAATAYYRVLDLAPAHGGAHNGLGVAFAQCGQWDEAVLFFRRAVHSDPQNADAFNNMGIALANQGKAAESEESYQEALRIRPNFPEALNNLSLVLTSANRTPEAIAALQRAIELRPTYFEARLSLGSALEKAQRFDEAIECHRETLHMKPGYAEAHNSVGTALYRKGDFAQARAEYDAAMRLKPDYFEALHNLGNLFVDQGEVGEGLTAFEQALRLNPDSVDVHWGRAQAWLRMGDFERGWPEFEWRWRRKDFPPPPYTQPRWNGSPFDGGTIFLYAEQGIGDTLQFIRYAPFVKERGGRVIVACQSSLVSLLSRCAGVDQVITGGDPLPQFEVHAPLLTLPGIFGTRLESIPATVPYLFPDPDRVERWQREASSISGLKIGLAWQGNPAHVNDYHRSASLDLFTPLGELAGVRLISLQKGTGSEQLAGTAEQSGIVDWGSQFETFHDTAAALKSLDLLITVDSALAHCAGALGIPVWVLLPCAADWRWLYRREDSPWYPTMRLFRQPEPRDWKSVFERVLQVLKVKLAARFPLSPGTPGERGQDQLDVRYDL